jgi:hypothetical protein
LCLFLLNIWLLLEAQVEVEIILAVEAVVVVELEVLERQILHLL